MSSFCGDVANRSDLYRRCEFDYDFMISPPGLFGKSR